MQEEDEEDKLWTELVMERLSRAVDASLTCLHILTSENMSKRVYLEDVIERCVVFTKFQLNATVYPAFDPVYRTSANGEMWKLLLSFTLLLYEVCFKQKYEIL